MASRTVQESRVVLRGESRTAAAFAKTAREANTLQQRFTGLRLGALGMGAAIGGITVGLAAATKAAIDAADSIGKTADGIGISTGALQEYRFAAQLAGVETQTIDGAFQAFGKRLGELKVGTGTLTTFLDKFDKRLKENIITAKDSDEALKLIFDAMAGIEDQSVKAAFAAAAFGRTAGVRMVNLVREGADGLAAMRQEARDLGVVLEDDAIRNAEAANDALTRLNTVITVNLQRALLEFAPLIERVANAFANSTPAIKQAADAVLDFFNVVDDATAQRLRETTDELVRLAAIDADPISRGITRLGDAIAEELGNETTQDKIASLLADLKEIERLQRAQERAFGSGPLGQAANENAPGAGTPTGLSGDREEREAERIRAANERLLADLHLQRVQASENEFELLAFRQQQDLDRIAQSQLTEEQRLEAIRLVNETHFAELEALEMQHDQRRAEERARQMQARLTAEELEAKRNAEIWESGLQGRLQITSGILGQIAVAFEGHSKKAFKIGKAFAIAQAVIDTQAAAVKAYKAMVEIPIVGPTLAAAAAAAAIVYGLARIKQIQSQTYSGGSSGGGSASSGASAPAAPSATGPANTGAGVPDLSQAAPVPRQINISIASDSGVVSTQWVVDNLIPALNDALSDGTVLNVTQAEAA